MAIVQLSRIQHRRGRKLAGTGLPQLASGELGWAIDTQELYIGNGAVSEGAPYVGNTKILTEHDNLFDLAGQYTYRPDVIPGTFARPLQRRLDDFVSVRAFGAFGDGTDQTVALQTAINSLYKPTLPGLDNSEKVVLYVPEGTYIVSDSIKIPSYVTLLGSGKDKTVIRSTSSSIFETINRPTEITTDTQPKYIQIDGMTLEAKSSNFPALVLNNCTDSIFRDLKIVGVTSSSLTFVNAIYHTGILLNAYSPVVTCKDNVFDNVDVEGFNCAVYSDTLITYNTFKDSTFKDLQVGILFGGTIQTSGPSFNVIENCVFDDIISEAIVVNAGGYNISKSNKFFSVGNNAGAQTQNITSVIRFETNTNVSDLDYFERTDLMADQSAINLTYLPEVEGRTNYRNLYARETSINQRFSFSNLLKLPFIERGVIYIDYVYEYVPAPSQAPTLYILREGTLEIICNSAQNTVALNDNYNFIGDFAVEPDLKFRVLITSVGTDKWIDLQAINATFSIGENSGKFYYTIRTKS
jgi:hypothetical protein